MSLADHTWDVRYKDKAVAWSSEDNSKHYAGRIVGPGPLLDAEGMPTSGVVEIHPDPSKSDSHPDGPKVQIPTDKIAAAHEAWRRRFMPPPAAASLLAAIKVQFAVKEKQAAVRRLLTAIAPGHELPAQVRLILTSIEGDAIPDGKGGKLVADDETMHVQKLGDFVTVLCSRRVFGCVREVAILSGMFEAVADWSVMMKGLKQMESTLDSEANG